MRPVRLVPVILTVLALGTQAAPAGAAPSDAETHCVVEVVAHAADGELLTVTDAAVAETVSSFTLGIHFDGASGSGSSISVTGSSCTGGYWNTPSTWDDRISSSWNGCARLRHWGGPSKTGSYQDTSGVGTTDNLTTMNNRTESVSYHAS